MGKFNEYSQKATPADNDTLMIYDATSKANKLSPFSGIWNWIVGKLTNAVISNLQTSNQTVLGAINELNSNNIKYKDITVSDFSIATPMISGTDKGYFSRVGAIKDYIPSYKIAISATIVAFGDCKGMLTAALHITQPEPAVYLMCNTASTITKCVIRIAYI